MTCCDKGDRLIGEYVFTVFDLGFVDGEDGAKDPEVDDGDDEGVLMVCERGFSRDEELLLGVK
jgi:hypothetical protein